MANKECTKCIHKAVCKTAESCDGFVSGCKHFVVISNLETTTREKLIALLDIWMEFETAEQHADHLIANGVTVQECGHWMPYQSDEPYGCNDEKEWYKCSKCGKDAYGRCYENEWYSAPILSNHCPRCGVKMMPQPPKGE